MPTAALDDLTVIDFSRVRAGPWCTQILGELGAEIIKIERPGVGDTSRGSYPEQNGMGVNFIARNRNKKSITLNLKEEDGRRIAEELIADADVLVENYSTGVMEQFGLGHEYLLTEVNPGLIYGSIKGYGEKGPKKDWKGVDLVMQAEGGIMSVTGPEDGEPVKVGQAIGDIGAGLYLTIAILAALHQRDRTGDGQHVESNLVGTIVSFLEEYITMYGITGEDPKPLGTRHQTGVPYELFDVKDGQVVLSILGGGWETFVTEIIEDESILKYDTQQLRQEHYDELMAVIRPKLKKLTVDEVIALCEHYGFPCGPLNNVSDVVEHPQAKARDYVIEYEDRTVGDVLLHGHPLHLSETDRELRSGPPELGEHTEEVLTEMLGFSQEEIRRLRASNAVGDE